MRSYLLQFFLIGIAPAVRSFSQAPVLMPRGMDHPKQLLKGKVSIEEISTTFTEATQSVVNTVSSPRSETDSVTIAQQVTNVHIYAQQLTISVENLNDHKKMVTHQDTMIGAFVSYISMINAISDSKTRTTQCRNQLVSINIAFRSISTTYLASGIDLWEEYNKHPHSPQYDPAKFAALDLDPLFDQVNPPAADLSTPEFDQSGEETDHA